MMRYVALLRGINVGGKNRVPMKELKQYTEDLGYEEVFTYINSGNVIFSSDSSAKDIRNKFEAMVLEKSPIDIPVMIVSYDDFLSAHSQVPKWWNQNKEDVNYAIFVLPPHKPESLILEVGLNEEFERLDCVD